MKAFLLTLLLVLLPAAESVSTTDTPVESSSAGQPYTGSTQNNGPPDFTGSTEAVPPFTGSTENGGGNGGANNLLMSAQAILVQLLGLFWVLQYLI
jgi:hypothetical protein